MLEPSVINVEHGGFYVNARNSGMTRKAFIEQYILSKGGVKDKGLRSFEDYVDIECKEASIVYDRLEKFIERERDDG